MTPPTEYDEDFYEGNPDPENDRKSGLPRLILAVVVVLPLAWAVLYFMVGPPEEHLVLYAIIPFLFLIVALTRGVCHFH